MGREFELKFAAKPCDLTAIQEKYTHLTPITMETSYYDNELGDMSRLHWTLRRRKENQQVVCALKTPGSGYGNCEWETECGNIEDAIERLCGMGAPKELLSLTAHGLHQVCGARFTRLAGLIEAEGCTVELALDQGVLTGAGREASLCEVEVELKSGSEEGAVAFAKHLAEVYGLHPEPKSKIQRALELTHGA